jgi:hypothetical protein
MLVWRRVGNQRDQLIRHSPKESEALQKGQQVIVGLIAARLRADRRGFGKPVEKIVINRKLASPQDGHPTSLRTMPNRLLLPAQLERHRSAHSA